MIFGQYCHDMTEITGHDHEWISYFYEMLSLRKLKRMYTYITTNNGSAQLNLLLKIYMPLLNKMKLSQSSANSAKFEAIFSKFPINKPDRALCKNHKQYRSNLTGA
jgi:hypothetical protein